MDPQSQFCHNPDCTARGQLGLGNISVHGRKEKRYRCSACGRTFAATRDTPFYRLKKPADLEKLTALQDRLLANAIAMTRPGGVVVYATCSLQPEEGIARIQALLDSGTAVERVGIEAGELGGLSDLITPEGDMRSLPFHLGEKGGMDGFYAARLRKR